MKSVFGPVQEAFVSGYVAEVSDGQTVNQFGAADDGPYVHAQPAVVDVEVGSHMYYSVPAERTYRSCKFLGYLPRRARRQDVDVTNFGDKPVRQHWGTAEDRVGSDGQLECPNRVPGVAGKPRQRTVTAVPLAETISIPPLLPAVMFS